MPATAQHLEWAHAHYKTAASLIRIGERPWGVVALFYAGMHLVHAGLPCRPDLEAAQQHPESHKGTTFLAEGTSVIVRRHISELDPNYRSLFDASIDVRYNGKTMTVGEANNHLNLDLPPIAAWACELIHADENCECWMAKL